MMSVDVHTLSETESVFDRLTSTLESKNIMWNVTANETTRRSVKPIILTNVQDIFSKMRT